MGHRIAVGVECLSEYRAGIARVGLDLFKALAVMAGETEYILVADREIPWVDVGGKRNLRKEQRSIFHPRLPDGLAIPLWTQFQLPHLLSKINSDLYLHTGTPPLLPFLPSWLKIRKIVFLHDVINVKSPEFFNPITFLHARLAKGLAVRFFDHILTISSASKKDAQEYLGADPERITVIPFGLSRIFHESPGRETMSRVQGKIGHDGVPFILFVGTMEPRKNLEGLLHAFRLSELAHQYRLVVVGAKGWKTEGVFQTVEKLGLTDSVTFTGFIPDDELCALYRSATLFCYPTFDEGFGLPVLEAMACGCPVVASKIPAIEEVGGDAPLYIDPKSKQSMASALQTVVGDDDLRESMARQGKERVRRFSWDRAALEVSKVIERVIGS
jgi:glycosyltransferase involved in cell wall biosynthesis